MQSRRAFTKSLMGSLSALAFAERESPARAVNVSLLDDVQHLRAARNTQPSMRWQRLPLPHDLGSSAPSPCGWIV